MSITSKIKDGKGTGNGLAVSKFGAASVVVHPNPPADFQTVLPYTDFFRNDAGSNNLIVATPQSFYIKASSEFDIFIKSISIQLSDPGADLNRFGALPELTNGVRFRYSSPNTGDIVIDDEIKKSLDFFRSATGGKGFGTGTGAFLADISGGAGEDTYLPEIDLSERFGLQWGLKLPRNSTAYLAYDVQDNLTGLSVFNIKAFGIRV